MMLANNMSKAKESGKRSSIILPCLLGLTVVYQLGFHFVVWLKMPADTVESPVTCWGTKGVAGQGKAIEGQCAEVEEFLKWQSSPELDLERAEEDWTVPEPDLLMVNSVGKAESKLVATNAPQSPASAGLKIRGKSMDQPDPGSAGLKLRSKSTERPEVATTKPLPSDLANEKKAEKPVVDSDHWAADLKSMMANMDAEMHHLAELHKTHMEHHQQRLKQTQTPHQTAEKPELLSQIEELQKEMCSDPRHKLHPTCVTFFRTHPVHHNKNSSEWIAGLQAAQVQVKSKLRGPKQDAAKDSPTGATKAGRLRKKSKSASIMEELKHKMHDLDEGLEKIHHKHEVWERTMASKALAIRVQMCAESHHKHNKACEKLWHELEAEATPDQKETKVEGTSGEPVAAVTDEAAAVAADPLHLLHLPVLATTERKGSRFMKKSVEPERRVLKADDLRNKHWGGKIPKVACIMAIPQSNGTDLERQAAIKTAVNAFRSESYEGPKQLVIVYQFHDRQAAKLAKLNADGFLVKAVGARGEVPSTMALRFGAYESDKDADVVARWDIDAFHHPERLSMQVRALGHSGRPTSLMMWGATLKSDGKRAITGEPYGLENSMVGLRGWMERNWRPYAGDDAPDHLAKVGDLVHLDMPELTHPTK